MMITMSIWLCLQAWVRPGWGRMLTYVRNQLTYLLYDASTETTKFRTFPDATQQPGLWAAFTALEELTYFLHATVRSRRESHADVSKEKQFRQQEGKEGGREEGRTAGSKRQWPSSKMLPAPSNLHMLLSNSCKPCAIYRFWIQNVVSTVQFIDFSGARSKHHASMCIVQMIIPTCCTYHFTCSFELQQAAK